MKNFLKRIIKFETASEAFQVMDLSLLKGRSYHACARIPDTHLIVITGGYDYDGNIHETTEILNLRDHTVTQGNPLNTKRDNHGMATITIDNQEQLAVFGGIDENFDSLESIETLNATTRLWEVSDLKLNAERHSFGYSSVSNDVISNL